MTYDHAFSCAGFAPERARFGLDNGLSLGGCLRLTDGRALGRLCGFVRVVRGATGPPLAGLRRWRIHLEEIPPKIDAPRPAPDAAEAAAPADDPIRVPAELADAHAAAALAAAAAAEEARFEAQAKKFKVSVRKLRRADALARAEPRGARPWCPQATRSLQSIVDQWLRDNPTLPRYPNTAECIQRLYAERFFYTPQSIAHKLTSLRGRLQHRVAAAQRRAQIADGPQRIAPAAADPHARARAARDAREAARAAERALEQTVLAMAAAAIRARVRPRAEELQRARDHTDLLRLEAQAAAANADESDPENPD
jgi:hypothetical protein